MPPGMQPPLIIQYNASTVPILQYSFSSPKMSEQQLFDVTANQVRIGLASTRGAMIPWPYGGKTRVVSVDLNLPALKAKNLIAQDVVNAINAQNLILPSGTTKIGATEYDVAVDANPRLIDDLNHLPIKVVNGATIYLSDVAQVHDGYTPQQNAVRQDGVRGALLTVMKAGAASTLDVVRNVKAALPRVMATVSPDLHVKEFADQSLFVRAAINGVLREGAIAAALTAMMILLFLGSWRSTLIIALSIPLSVLCSIATLSALGETINLMTLGGLALAVGILVDDATVAIENIHRHMAAGQKLEDAILDRLAGNRVAGVCLDAVHLHRVRADVFSDRRGALSVRAAGRGRGVRHARQLRPFAHARADAGDVVLPQCETARRTHGRSQRAGRGCGRSSESSAALKTASTGFATAIAPCCKAVLNIASPFAHFLSAVLHRHRGC